MIDTLYRRPGASTTPAAVFDPDAVAATDPLFGAVPTWRLDDEDDVEWHATVRALGGDPTTTVVRSTADVLADELPPTVALTIVPTPTASLPTVQTQVGLLTQLLVERPRTPRRAPRDRRREAGTAASELVLRAALLVVCVVLAVLAFGQAGSGRESGIVPTRVPSPCPAGTAPGCPDGPRP